ncbi:MAG: hypothetical protein M1839_000279 [Geoglossum umbratile]|nr:MAG: hypothetical protein M1839_000279 [Geoglossum umbratile]
MKFGHEFQEALKRDDFPQHWVKSAIAYGQLKKCIKKVQGELSGLGLDAQTLKHFLQAVEDGSSSAQASFQYSFTGNENAFYPRLVFIVNAKDGIPIGARLSTRTRDYLESLALSQRTSQDRLVGPQDWPGGDEIPCPPLRHEGSIVGSSVEGDSPSSDDSNSISSFGLQGPSVSDSKQQVVEIPLTSDSEFFRLLKSEVSSLDTLQAREEALATEQVASLGKEVARVAAPSKAIAKTDIYRWREIIDLYSQASIFYSTNEADHGSRNSAVAQKQLQWFLAELEKRNLLKQFKRRGSPAVLNQFVQMNMELLRNLKFQEINRLAMAKILKKFDKRTALDAQSSFPELVASGPFLVHNISRAICFKVNEELLTVVPQLNDYLCPVCFNISYKPIRLSCSHVFCIRCMITMQRAGNGHCPMCRGDVVMKADSTNLDPALMNFLEKYFPTEVKIKQKENMRAVMIDYYGPEAKECIVM